VDLLTLHQPARLVERIPESRPPPEVLADVTEEYQVEGILDSRRRRRALEFLVKWKNYPLEEATWEPEKNLTKVKKMITEFYDKHPEAVKSSHIEKPGIIYSQEFRDWRNKNICPSVIREDAQPRKGVMSRVPLTNHYSFLNLPKKPILKHPFHANHSDSSHPSPLHHITSSHSSPTSPITHITDLDNDVNDPDRTPRAKNIPLPSI
jgi:hypothetical protein